MNTGQTITVPGVPMLLFFTVLNLNKNLENYDVQFLETSVHQTAESAMNPDMVSITAIAIAGVVFSFQDVRTKGVLNGKLTIYSDHNIWIDDNNVHAEDAETNPNSDDPLGLVSGNSVLVSDNPATNSDPHIQASVMSINGFFTLENLRTRSPSRVVDLNGTIAPDVSGPGSVFSPCTGQVVHGFNSSPRFDDRLKSLSSALPVPPGIETRVLVGMKDEQRF